MDSTAVSAAGATVAVLAGGTSARMGRDKALIERDGETWLGRVVREALAVPALVLVVGRPRPAGFASDGVVFLLDERPGQGPLGGLVTALHEAGGDVAAVACDMPLLDRAALCWLLDAAAAHPEAAAVVAEQEGRVEPLFAVYRQSALPEAEARLARGERALWRLVEALVSVRLPVPAELAARLANVNEPGDLARLGPAGDP